MKGCNARCSYHEHKDKGREVWRQSYAAHKQCGTENAGYNKQFFIELVTKKTEDGLQDRTKHGQYCR